MKEYDPQKTWESSFKEQIAQGAYNTAPVEALVRTVSYWLRDRYPKGNFSGLHFLEMGCGAGPNLLWLAKKGIRVSGVDISKTALSLANENLRSQGCSNLIGKLEEGSVTRTSHTDQSFDGILESCVFQHLNRADRQMAFAEVNRLLKPGGVFVGHMLDQDHTIFELSGKNQLKEDPGTLYLSDGSSNFHLTNIGLSHFFKEDEFRSYFPSFSVVEPLKTSYDLPSFEARKRSLASYHQSMWVVYAVK